MKIEELKLKNLKRLCRKFKAEETTKLASVLGATKQHASQILSGKSAIGSATIEKLCKAWGIQEEEFILMDAPDIPGGQGWEPKAIYDQLSKRLDQQDLHIANALAAIMELQRDVSTRGVIFQKALADTINSNDASLNNFGEAINNMRSSMNNIVERIAQAERRMDTAAEAGDVALLRGKTGTTG